MVRDIQKFIGYTQRRIDWHSASVLFVEDFHGHLLLFDKKNGKLLLTREPHGQLTKIEKLYKE